MYLPLRFLTVLFLLLTGVAVGQQPLQHESGVDHYIPEPTECISLKGRRIIEKQIEKNRKLLGIDQRQKSNQIILFDWPLRAAEGFEDYEYHGISNFVDHNANYPDQITDYQCGARSYDLSEGYNHAGTDFFTWPFGWYKMDYDQVEIVSMADGVIVNKSDGNYDRNCGFGGGNWNAVYVEHADGSIAWYGHMKEGSPTSKAVGETVVAGEYLGVIGSSGNSTGPHLHLEIYDDAGLLIDPFDGACNSLNNQSWWADQRPYYDSGINKLATHNAVPDWGTCPEQEITNEFDSYCGGDLIYFISYYRDQLLGQVANHRVLRPDGSVWVNWDNSLGVEHYAASWWWSSFFLPANPQQGLWTYEVDYEGESYAHQFWVGMPDPQFTVSVSGQTAFVTYEMDLLGVTALWQLTDAFGTDFPAQSSYSYWFEQDGPNQICLDQTNACGTSTLCLDLNLGGACGSDFDQDGSVGTSDLLMLLAGIGCTGPCVGDADGNGVVNSADLLSFLAAYATIC